MAYVEYLRVRQSLIIFAIVLALGAVVMTISIANASHGNHASHDSGSHRVAVVGRGRAALLVRNGRVVESDLSTVLGIDSLFAIVFATIIGTSLNKENGRGGFAFTKPIARVRLALGFFAIDAAAIVLAYAYTIALGTIVLASLGYASAVVVDDGSATAAALGLGIAFMWYGLLQAATAMRISNGGLLIGLSWPFFLLGLGLYHLSVLGPIFHAGVAAVDFFNPLAYWTTTRHEDVAASLLGFSDTAAIALTWTIAIAACGAATFAWRRLEV